MKRTTNLCAVIVTLLTLTAATAPTMAVAAPPKSDSAARGSLDLRVVGLPPGQPVPLRLTGPAQKRHGPRLRRRLTPHKVGTVIHLAPGNYRLSASSVSISRAHGLIEKGAVAKPSRRRFSFTIKRDKTKRVNVRFGSILNPGVRDVSRSVARVLGSPIEPSAVVLRPGVRVQPGQILSSRASAKLPHGLLARVLSVGGDGREQAVLRGASIYEVAPSFSFDVPVTVTEGATASQLAECSKSASAPGATPFVKLDNFHVSGGWSTSRLGFVDVKTGATAELHFDAAAGIKVSTSAALKCELDLPAYAFQGMAGPIPVYGGIRPGATASVSGGASMTSEGSTEVTLGVKADGLPPKAAPVFDFSSPKFTVSSSISAEVEAGLSLAAEVGVGAENAADVHVDLTNGIDFTAKPGQCSWDLDLGAFSATGQLGPLSISTPSTPSLHKNLWHSACGAPTQPPAPAPAAPSSPSPAPTPEPAPLPAPMGPALPLTRAVMSWGTDADVDLYTWDQYGDELNFAERSGIFGAELVEDVIPFEGETSHQPEVFRETAEPNRFYTFGICDFHREGGPVTLEVMDPGGSVRVFSQYLEEEGDGVVITTSPLGVPFEPEPGWCRFDDDFSE